MNKARPKHIKSFALFSSKLLLLQMSYLFSFHFQYKLPEGRRGANWLNYSKGMAKKNG